MSELLKLTEVEKILNISRTLVYQLAHREDFPTIRFGKAIRVPRVALERWIENQARKGNGENG